ncbi:MAG: DUF4340 domain-containing protein, partial [Acidobacteriota bacterium]|nr:DUF4340 domain-containing protein [Acidobacteriota bacterium]
AQATETFGWRVVEPLEARADEDEIADVLDSLTHLTKERTLDDIEPQELGLNSPTLTVRLSTSDEEWALQVGEEVPATSNVIMAVEGRDEAYVVSGDFREDLEKKPGEWRSRDAFPFERKAVTRVVLSAGGDEVVLRREGEDFRLEAPFSDEADEDKVSDLLDALTGLEIDTFLDEPPPQPGLGLQPAVSVIRVGVGEEQDVEIRLGSRASDDEELRYALVDGQVFLTETELGELAPSPASDWRSRGWTKLEVFAVEKLRLREGESELVLERSGGDWLRGGDKIAYTTASDVLYAIGDTEARGITTGESVKLEAPLLEFLLSSKDSEETLRLYTEPGGVYRGVREGREAVLELSRESVDELRAKIQVARDAEPLPSPIEEGDLE